eukprot:Gregarina_sp_Poly_1__2212@NODE_158_length_12340_cov_321_502159_g140_i0_p1_GENE_NODE_158_length_12340_cov_321_502159_g140_i0NODE_158_length_12340_cov_321_502159_g140_i0_p1_ORF_typecomplete_len1205_score152_51Patched/PF02460_18/2_7e114Sterolsensing/PF12349_8/1_2e27Sterolsensing/PF12349_8/2_6e03Sterolsensing/PF12349_8/1_1MMPL/PF03176_15/1_9e10MMPL/PF03176_15/5_1e08FtsX/PF02687_21/1_8e04FtsX/PF02687_21/1_2e04FtsX/PF02687_21/0_16ACR_tran/PF00873_19/1_6e03ACR_tran/PF00873_19/2_2e02ACR_tran/PF00873_19/
MGLKDKINGVLAFKEDFVDKLNELFGRWGCLVFDHAYIVIVSSLLFTIIPVFGFLPSTATWVDGADRLYSLPVSEARNAGVVRDTIFYDGATRANFMIITSNPPGHNVLTWEILEYARQVDELVRGRRVDEHSGLLVAIPAVPKFYPEFFNTVSNSTVADKPRLTYDDICSPDPVTGCRIQSVFEAGIEDMKLLVEEDAPPELYVLDGLVFNTKRKGYAPSFLLGEMEKMPCVRSLPVALLSQLWDESLYNVSNDGMATAEMECIVSAKALNFVYETIDKPEFLERQLAWESLFYEVLRNNQFYGPLLVGANAFRSRDDELSKATAESDDVIFVLYTFIMLIVYTTLVNFNFDLYRSKAMASMAGSVACLFGLFAGLGIPSLFGTAFVPTSLIAPFLVIGVGADDIFVLIGSYALTYGEDTARQRCAVTLRGCGVSVVMTTVTNVIAFAIGIQSPYLSVRNFCIFTLFGLLFGLLYELTFFFAFMCLDAKREEHQKACYHYSYENDKKNPKVAFDIRTAVSTYQVVHVIVQGVMQRMPELQIVPLERSSELQHLRLWQYYIKRFREAGLIWFRPEMSTAGWITPETSTTQSPPHKSGANIDSSDDDAHSITSHSEQSVCVTVKSHESDGMGGPRHSLEDIELIEEMQQLIKPKVPVNRFLLNPKLHHCAYKDEPKGNVGRNWRKLFVFYYCRWLLHPGVKALVILVFLINICFVILGFTRLTQGLELKDLSPDDSYLKVYDQLWASYIYENDLPVEVFFPEPTAWWDPRAINTLTLFVDRINGRPENNMLNDPLTRMVADSNLAPSLQSGNKTEFLGALKEALSDPTSPYKQFEFDFIWKGKELAAFRQQLLPAGTTSSKERAHWILTMRSDIEWLAHLPDNNVTMPLNAMFYNYMLVFYESDIQIMKSVVASLTTASMAMLVIAFLLIPDLASGLIVIGIMILIDITIVGYMAFWDVPLNMISMVMLVVSVGFAVDYSAHICYAFVNAIGSTRSARVIEALVLVGTPLFHGASSNILGVMLLGFSTSYILRIFFKMMCLVVLFGISHGVILLPVLLSILGPMSGSVPVYKDELPPTWFKDQERKKQVVRKVSLLSSPNEIFDTVNMSVFTHTIDDSESSGRNHPAIWYKDGHIDGKSPIDSPDGSAMREKPTVVNLIKRSDRRRMTVEFIVPDRPEEQHSSEDYARTGSAAGSEATTPIPKRK